jgi:hypothetical protein
MKRRIAARIRRITVWRKTRTTMVRRMMVARTDRSKRV